MLASETITTFANRLRVFRFGIASFGAATCTGSSDQAGGGAEFATFPFADGTFATGRISLTANVAGAPILAGDFTAWAFFEGEVRGTALRDDDWQVGDELTWTLEVPWRCTYGAVERDVVSSTTRPIASRRSSRSSPTSSEPRSDRDVAAHRTMSVPVRAQS